MVTASNVAARHHTVPRLYLRRFADSNRRSKYPQVWVTDGHNGARRPASVTNTSVSKDFYGPFEEVLAAHIDTTRMGELFDRVEQGDAFGMSGEDLGDILFYLALQLTRTPAFRGAVDDMLQLNANEALRVDPRPQAKGLLRDMEMLALVSPPSEFVPRMLSTAVGVYHELAAMKIVIVRAPAGQFFVTSDTPVAVGPLAADETECHGLREDFLVFPLSPRTCLTMSHHLPRHGYLEKASPDDGTRVHALTTEINRLVCRRAQRWIYSHRQDAADTLELRFPLDRFRTITRRLGAGIVQTVDLLLPGGSLSGEDS